MRMMTLPEQTTDLRSASLLLGSDLRGPARECYLPVGEYAALGDGRTLVLVGSDGSVDWMCLPDIDSPSVFGALLDSERGGRFVLAPTIPYTINRAYLERTNVLETTFQTAEGSVRVTEAMTIDSSQNAPWRELVRRLEGLSGTVPMAWRFEPRFEYGREVSKLSRMSGAVVARHGELQLALQSWDCGEGEIRGAFAAGEFELRDGESALLSLQAAYRDPLPLPRRDAIE
jgi:GH15 family glucan-1,4-alpha-glucosidase